MPKFRLEKTFENKDVGYGLGMNNVNHWMTGFSFISETYGLVLVNYNGSNHSLDLYRAENYSFFKSISLTPFVAKSNNLELFILFISEKLFDPDNAFEFLLSTYKGTGNSLLLCKDNGTLIKDFGDARADLVYGCDVYKLAIRYWDYDYERIEYYSLPGTLPACYGGSLRSSNIQSNSVFRVYPNPAKMDINIPYSLDTEGSVTLSIYTQNGALKEQRTISGTGTARINTSRYAPGVYIYKYNDVSGQFIIR